MIRKAIRKTGEQGACQAIEHLVGVRDRELAIERIRRDGHPMMRLRRGAPLLHGLGPNPFSPHAPCETLFADIVPRFIRASQMLGLP